MKCLFSTQDKVAAILTHTHGDVALTTTLFMHLVITMTGMGPLLNTFQNQLNVVGGEREKEKKMQRAILALTEGKKTMARIFMQIPQATPPLSRHLHFSFSTEKDPLKDVENILLPFIRFLEVFSLARLLMMINSLSVAQLFSRNGGKNPLRAHILSFGFR